MTIQTKYIPTPSEADRWRDFASLAHQVGDGTSKDYHGLNGQGVALSGATVFGTDNAENPCNRLRKAVLKAAYAPFPGQFHATLRECSRAILFAYGVHFGEPV